MTGKLTLRRIGNSLGFTVPKAMTDRLHVKEGDTLYVVAEGNGFHVTPYDPAFEEAVQAVGDTRAKYRNTFLALAKYARLSPSLIFRAQVDYRAPRSIYPF